MASGLKHSSISVNNSGLLETVTTTLSTKIGTRLTNLFASLSVKFLGEVGTFTTKPMASAPASTAVVRSSSRVTPQIFTLTILVRRRKLLNRSSNVIRQHDRRAYQKCTNTMITQKAQVISRLDATFTYNNFSLRAKSFHYPSCCFKIHFQCSKVTIVDAYQVSVGVKG